MTNSLINRRDTFADTFPETRKTINGRKWGVLQQGNSGPALVLLPGTLGRADIFWQQIEQLRDQAQILSLSYPASGTIEQWCDDICQLMTAYGISSATILGSSLGGYLAQYFTATRFEQSDALVAANTMSDLSILKHVPPYNTDIDKLPIAQLMGGFRDALENAPRDTLAQSELVDFLLVEVAGRIREDELRTRLKALQSGPPLPAQKLNSEHVFTVESGNDPLIPPFVREQLRQTLLPKKSFVYEQGSHFPYLIEPDRYVAMLREIIGLPKC